MDDGNWGQVGNWGRRGNVVRGGDEKRVWNCEMVVLMLGLVSW